MRILFVNHLLDPVSGGGTAERTYQLTRFLLKEGVECAVLTLDIGPVDEVGKELRPAKVYKLRCINRRYFFPLFSLNVLSLIKSFDAIHLIGHWTILNVLVATCCIVSRVPYVVCPAGALKSFGRSKKLKRLYDFVFGRQIIKRAQGWIAITEDEKQDFLSYGIPPESVTVIPNGIDPHQYQLTEPIVDLPGNLQEKINGSDYVLFLGRLNLIKGPDLLLTAFGRVASRFPNLHLVFAGPDSGMIEQLKEMAADAGLEGRTHFLGYVGGKDKAILIRRAHCLVIPSRNEAMSIVVLEGGVCGTPVIFSDRCGLDGLASNRAGLMVEATAESICNGLERFLTRPEEAKEFSSRLQSMVSNFFLWEVQVQRYLDMFRKLLLKNIPMK